MGLRIGKSQTCKIEATNKLLIQSAPVAFDFYGVFSGKPMYHAYPDGNEVYIISTVYFCDKYTGNLEIDNNEVLQIEWFNIDRLPNNIAPIDSYILQNLHLFLEKKFGKQTHKY